MLPVYRKHRKLLRTMAIAVVPIAIIILMVSAYRTFAFGISPSAIFVNNMTPGSVAKSVVYFSRANAEKEEYVKVLTKGPAGESISFPDEIDTVVFPKGENTLAFDFLINAGSLPTGTYKAYLVAAPIDSVSTLKEGASGTSLVAGAQAEVTFEITNDAVEKYSVENLIISDSETEQELGFALFIKNDGNTDARPAAIIFKIYNGRTGEFVENIELREEDIPFVKAFTEENVLLNTKSQLPIGFYEAKILVLDKNSENIYEVESIRFQVFPVGTLAQSGELEQISADKELYEIGELAEISGVFTNTGSVSVKATFITEIFRDDNRIDLLKSESTFVQKGSEVALSNIFKIKDAGKYEVKGYVTFGPYKTEVSEASFSVGSFNIWIVVIGLAILIVFITIVAFIIKRRKQQSNVKSPSATSTPGTPAPPITMTPSSSSVPSNLNPPNSATGQPKQ